MHHPLPFFPASLPDETLFSRVSRYHLLRGNRTDQQTFDELFSQKPFILSRVVPPFTDVLAARLPGSQTANLQSIINQNTLFPLFRPFLGRVDSGEKFRPSVSAEEVQINHMPSHVVGMSGDAKLCLSCVREDEERHGVAYWHRAHQIPGVTTCCKHNELTISSCPHCERPFQRLTKLLKMPWVACECKEGLREMTGKKPHFELEHRFAKFTYEMLTAEIPPIRPSTLATVYRDRIRKRGFVRKTLPAVAAFTQSMIETCGEDFIRLVDPAYSSNRIRWWLRFTFLDSGLDLPITRHMLLGMHLFGRPAEFAAAIAATEAGGEKQHEIKVPEGESDDIELRDQHRKRVLDELRRDPKVSMEKLWKKNYRTTAWLFDNDRTWLKKIVSGAKAEDRTMAYSLEKERAQRDKEYADIVEQFASRLFKQPGKPSLITMEKMFNALPKRMGWSAEEEEQYPLLYSRISQCRESTWCFRARRILWAISELKRLDMSLTAGNIAPFSRVGYNAVVQILHFARWDCEALAAKKFQVADELAKAGIGRTWRGPSELMDSAPIGGRGYRATHRRSRNILDT
ncbi:TnsD family Tn7-like transposition protein [Massilia terrae]|uniref:TnsD family transposase n=1 Tax=Massilia terrae TaxID=1811224 RepID=A0ABT2D0M0_9BURK|nr:TnsD family Tn7-like transposition protein [Massilia terrae]MCS0659767.1 TnsD family transposase [Massilia terrae]